jgi:hypothetical protein
LARWTQRFVDPQNTGLDREAIVKALQDLSDELVKRNVKGELCLFGGSVMVLAYATRISTKDVDAIFQPAQAVREAVASIGELRGWKPDWLNDGVKGFLSTRHETVEGGLPQFPNLHVTMPTPEYLLAMKCMASRLGVVEGDADDLQDIKFLIQHLKLKDVPAVMDLVAQYYPAGRIPIKAQYLVEGLFGQGTV